MNWRDMTLSEVYQYWILGLVPDDDIPYVACNDMLAGNMTDEIVDLAGLSRPDAWELAHLLPRAFAQLGLQPMTEKESAKRVAMPLRREIAQRIVSGEGDPLWGANAIYDYAANAGVYRDRGDADNQVAK